MLSHAFQNYAVESHNILKSKCVTKSALIETFDYLYGEYASDKIYFRILGHSKRIDFSLRQNFSRWANSVEFSLFYFPEVEDWPTLIEEAERICKEHAEENRGFGTERDIVPFLNKKVIKAKL